MSNYGGNLITEVALGKGMQTLATDPYYYAYYKLDSGSKLELKELRSFTVLALKVGQTSSLSIQDQSGKNYMLVSGDALQVENSSVEVKANEAETEILVAGTVQAKDADHSKDAGASVTLTAAEAIKKVSKPWGYELWINGEHSNYALKQICLHSGFKTSLQYHDFKRETNFLMRGKSLLHYSIDPEKPKSQITTRDITTVEFNAPSLLDVWPGTIHRIEALSDLYLFETSTPHLDDVIRISDDAQRPDGRIATEHAPT